MKLGTTVLFCLFIISSYGQGKAIKKAISKGSDANEIYLASFNKPIDEDKIMQWFEGSNYSALSVLEGKIARFGSYHHGIVGVRFMDKEVYARHIAAEAARRQRAMASAQSRNRRSNSSSSFVEDYGGAIIGTALFAAAVYGAYKFVTSSSSGGGSYSQNNNYSPSYYDVEREESKPCNYSLQPTDQTEVSGDETSVLYKAYCDGNWFKDGLIYQTRKNHNFPGKAGWWNLNGMGTDSYLGATKDEALSKLCKCN